MNGQQTGRLAMDRHLERTDRTRRRVLCVEDDGMFSELLAVAFEREPDLEVVHRTEDVAEAVAVLRSQAVDVVVMDCSAPMIDGIDALRQLKQVSPTSRVVLLTAYPTLELVVRAAACGADGFLAKDGSLSEIMAAVRADTQGIEIGDGTLAALRLRVRDEGNLGGRRWDPHLTDRERDVIALLAEGFDPQTIATHLGITVHTSRSYVRNVLAKLGAHSQLEAVVVAARCGLVTGLCACAREHDADPGLRAG